MMEFSRTRMKRSFGIIAAAVIALLLVGCSSGDKNTPDENYYGQAQEESTGDVAAATGDNLEVKSEADAADAAGTDAVTNTTGNDAAYATVDNSADDASIIPYSAPVSTNYLFESCTDEYESDCLIIHISKETVESTINNDWVYIFASDYSPIYTLEVYDGVTSNYYSGEGAPDPDSNPDAKIWCCLKFMDEGDFNKSLGTIYSGNTSTSIKDGYYSFYFRLSNRKFGIDTNKVYGDLIIQESSGERSAKATPATDIPEGFVYYYEHVESDHSASDEGSANDFGYDIPESDFYVYANKDAGSFTSHSGHIIYTPEEVPEYDVLRIEMSNGYALVYDTTDGSCVLKETWSDGKEYLIPSEQIKLEGNNMDIYIDIPQEDKDFNLFEPNYYVVMFLKNWQMVTSYNYQASTSDPENSVMIIVE